MSVFGFAKRGLVISCCSILALQACSTSPEKINKTDVDGVNVAMSTQAGLAQPEGIRSTKISVTKGGKNLKDVPCVLTGNSFSAEFTAPANVNLPSYGVDSRAVTLSCIIDEARHSTRVAPVNLTAANRKGNAVAAGVLLAGVVGGVVGAAAAQPKPGDVYGYKPIVLKIK